MLYTMQKRAEEVRVLLARPYLSQWSFSAELRKQQKSLAGLAEVKFLHLYRLKEGGLHVWLWRHVGWGKAEISSLQRGDLSMR